MDRLNERAELMGRMLDTIGAMKNVPVSMQADMDLRSAAFRCINCRETDTCMRWLEEHPDGAERALPECPNAELFNSWLDT
ncbi:MAG: DUF6455 family protein [Roseibium sp.]|uniref:DUF6455 family protein n=1 Tax=Roseibium sp. TaxID=1936156 RepID=UPI002629FF4A|nr:DUF6455 family protein [Roseibium sp.]MCV0428232.1 DUF6455 family protein [Roseibium sp.]